MTEFDIFSKNIRVYSLEELFDENKNVKLN